MTNNKTSPFSTEQLKRDIEDLSYFIDLYTYKDKNKRKENEYREQISERRIILQERLRCMQEVRKVIEEWNIVETDLEDGTKGKTTRVWDIEIQELLSKLGCLEEMK